MFNRKGAKQSVENVCDLDISQSVHPLSAISTSSTASLSQTGQKQLRVNADENPLYSAIEANQTLISNDIGNTDIIEDCQNDAAPKQCNANFSTRRELPTFDFTRLELLCPIDASEISCRWLKPYIPMPGQKIKTYPAGVLSFMSRILKSYAANCASGRALPPFLHFSQSTKFTMHPHLATCLSLVHIYDGGVHDTGDALTEVLQLQMHKLYQSHGTLDNVALLAAFQACLIYTMVCYFFQYHGRADSFLHQAMMNLQEIACINAQHGLLCLAESQATRPKWEAWIVAEARRRTLYTMYMFDSVLSSQDNLPSYLSTELTGLLAPGGKALWEVHDRREWERRYNVHLVSWSESYLSIDELWPMEPTVATDILINRRCRVDRWLQEVDEFGTMLFAVTSMTHGA